jgi:hypothetical protein
MSYTLSAQKFITREGKVSFYSSTPLEKIEAHNFKGSSVLDMETGRVEFAVLVKAFLFEKALMQEHFNENYMESDKYPKALVKGNIMGFEQIKLDENKSFTCPFEGELKMHGVSRPISSDLIINVVDGKLDIKTNFNVAVADYNIKIPNIVRDKIAKNVEIEVDAHYTLFQ